MLKSNLHLNTEVFLLSQHSIRGETVNSIRPQVQEIRRLSGQAPWPAARLTDQERATLQSMKEFTERFHD